MTARWSSFSRRLALGSMVLVLTLSACGGDDDGTPQAAGKDRTIQAGLNDPNDKTIAVMAFLPTTATVEVGAVVTWNLTGPEPHTVTFVPPGAKQPLPSDPDSTLPTPSPSPTAGYDGTARVNSGLLGFPKPGTFKLAFSKAGSHTYYCAIHPQMVGKLSVVDAGGQAQREMFAQAGTETREYLKEGRDAKKSYVGKPAAQKQNADGSTTWTVEMGVSTQHTTILAFQPLPLNMKKGDKVTFVNNDTGAPHTASFGGDKVPQDPESKEATESAPGTSPQTLNASDFFNTGWLPPNAPPGAGPPRAARSFTFNVPAAGTYTYVCIPHAPSGMTGSIVAS